mmetsp:Transcript_4376/g.7404  ORF Transcript_4376/g.7404 Transcript_4376/m.7404 type:complete len:87 (+) Transcript_4376:107-367(+)
MLQVVDKKTGRKVDVRAMLGITDDQIKDSKLRETLSNYSMGEAKGEEKEGEGFDMGQYYQQLDVLVFERSEYQVTELEDSMSLGQS